MNKHSVSYPSYADKMYGCWVGKTLGGTIGAPFEGIKMPMDLEYDPKMLDVMLPNDDLDLQLLWFDVVRRKGLEFTSRDLQEIFIECCDYSPGEYAVMRKNGQKGIYPPYSGRFCNDFYAEGMGCPIRSEIWACLAPGRPDLAVELAQRDGVIDHTQPAVDGERFFAALESMAFVEEDLDTLIEESLTYIAESDRMRNAIADSARWSKQLGDSKKVLRRILKKYGHPDCTNVYQNVAIIIMALYLGDGDLIATNMLCINSGFDTDCTCATASSILGILKGSDYFQQYAAIDDLRFVAGVRVSFQNDTIRALSDEVAAMACRLDRQYGFGLFKDAPPAAGAQTPFSPLPPYVIRVDYMGLPSVGVQAPCEAALTLCNHTGETRTLTLQLVPPEGLLVDLDAMSLRLEPEIERTVPLRIALHPAAQTLMEKNIVLVRLLEDGAPVEEFRFGVSGAQLYTVYGPFWRTEPALSDSEITSCDSYFKYLGGDTSGQTFDNIRNFHINFKTDPLLGVDYEPAIFGLQPLPEELEPELVNLHEDSFRMEEVVGMQGPCVVYLKRILVVPENTKACLQVGYSDGVKLWLNGEVLLENQEPAFFTSENAHLVDLPLCKGDNELVLRLTRRTQAAKYSLIFSKEPTCAEHIVSFGSRLPAAVTYSVYLQPMTSLSKKSATRTAAPCGEQTIGTH